MAKIVFFGTPEYVVPIVEALKLAGHQILAVVTQPDKPVGRKGELTPSPVALWASAQKVMVMTPAKLEAGFLREIKSLQPDVLVLAAYARLVPWEALQIAKHGGLNLHPSLLPKYRGASPVQAAIAAGEKQTGVTIIQMDRQHDHGPIVAQFSEELRSDDTTGSLRARLFQKAAGVLVEILPAYLERRVTPREQDHQKATFTKILKKEDGKIDWRRKPEEIERFIRAMQPWPGAWTLVRLLGQQVTRPLRLKILKAHLEENPRTQKPNIPKARLVLDLVQLEGKNPVSWSQFRQGYPQARFRPEADQPLAGE